MKAHVNRSSSDSLREFAERRILVAEEHEQTAKLFRQQATFFHKRQRPASEKRMIQHALHHENKAREARAAAQEARSKTDDLDGNQERKEIA